MPNSISVPQAGAILPGEWRPATVANAALERQVAAASCGVEEARRAARRDPRQLGALVEKMSVLADLRQQEGEFRKAESLFREALSRTQDGPRPEPELLCGIHSLLGHLYDREGRRDAAAECYEKALKIAEANGASGDKAGVIKNNLAMIYKQTRNFEKAEQYYREALKLFQAAEGDRGPRVAGVLNNLGVLYYACLEIERSQTLQEEALKIRQSLRHDPLNPADLSQTYVNLGAAYKATGDFQKAETCVEKAKKIRAGMNGFQPDPRRLAALMIDKFI